MFRSFVKNGVIALAKKNEVKNFFSTECAPLYPHDRFDWSGICANRLFKPASPITQPVRTLATQSTSEVEIDHHNQKLIPADIQDKDDVLQALICKMS